MDIILLQDVDALGTAGDIVNVKPGFARNFLFPRGLALRASKRNLAIADERKRNVYKRREHDEKINLVMSTCFLHHSKYIASITISRYEINNIIICITLV